MPAIRKLTGRPAWLLAAMVATFAMALVLVPAASAQGASGYENGRIAFRSGMSSKDCGYRVETVNPDGTDRKHVFGDHMLVWSPDGTKMATVFNNSTETECLDREVRADGVGRTDNSVDDSHPTWAPDGTRVAYESLRPNVLGGEQFDLYVLETGGATRRLTDSLVDDLHPAWSPDGSRIAFTTNRDGNFELYTIRPDGTELTRLTDTPTVHEFWPAWSPDGAGIAFGTDEGISVMRPDGSERRELIVSPAFRATDPAWSPDGTKIAFIGSPCSITVWSLGVVDSSYHWQCNGSLWVVNADGTGATQLLGGDGQTGFRFPAWQPLLQPPGSIAGKVTSVRGKRPIEGAGVDCTGGASATTASDGTYRITSVPVRTYTCTASAWGYQSKAQTVTVTSNTETRADFSLTPSR